MAFSRRKKAVLVLFVLVVAGLVAWQWSRIWYPVRVRMILAGGASDVEKAEDLKALGSEAIPSLIGYFESSGNWRQKYIVGNLLVHEPYRRITVAERALDADDATLRRIGVFVLVNAGQDGNRADRVLEVTAAWTADRAFGHRLDLVSVLQGISNPLRGDVPPEAIDLLVDIVEGGSDEVREARAWATEVLGRTGSPRALRALVEVAKGDDDLEIRARAAQGLGKLGYVEDMDLYEGLLDADEDQVRMRLAIGLADLGRREAGPLLARLLEDRNPIVRREALSGLTAIRSPVVDEKARYLREDGFMGVRGDVAIAIQDLGLAGRVPVLVQGLLEKEPDDDFNILRKNAQAIFKLTGEHIGFPLEYFRRENREGEYERGVMRAWWERDRSEKLEMLAPYLEKYGEYDRRGPLLAQLRHADPTNVARAARELHILDPDAATPGFTTEKLDAALEDFDPRRAPFLAIEEEAKALRALEPAKREALLAEWDVAHAPR